MLSTRKAHEEMTAVGDFIKAAGHEIYILSTESVDLVLPGSCRRKTMPLSRVTISAESHGVVANAIVEAQNMEYNLGGNTILWFSLILFR